MATIPDSFLMTAEVSRALAAGTPVMALESAVITHGLPRPQNLELARAVEAEARAQGVTPATTALLDGRVRLGLSEADLVRLADAAEPRKISRRDFGIALAKKTPGGTTVAGTLIVARTAGIRVFATGGIGGIHRDAPFDVSADLTELAHSPLVVVCAGAKAILDLPATLEYLETVGVPVVGFQTDEFPAFYSRESGLGVDARVDSAEEAAEVARAQWKMGLESAVLVVVPPPAEVALPPDQMETIIRQALSEAADQKIHGAKATPFLLARVSELTNGASMQTNLAFLRNNARIGAQIARALSGHGTAQSA